MRSSTALTSRPAFFILLVLGAYSLCISKFNPLKTLLSFLFASFIAFVIARLDRGIPFTLAGVEAAVKTHKAPPQFKSPRFQLVAHPINHFGEKARWILDKLEIPYEETDVGGILLSLLRGRSVPWLVDRQANSVIGNSDEIVLYLGAVMAPENVSCRRTEKTREWETDLNALGHAIQGFGYGIALAEKDPHFIECGKIVALTAWGAYETSLVPLLDRLTLLYGYPLLKMFMTEVFKLRKQSKRDGFKTTIDRVLDKADKALEASPFLAGDELTYVDISLASLLGVLLPTAISFSSPKSKWARGRFHSFSTLLPKLGGDPQRAFSPALLAFERHVLERPVGKHVLKLYTEHR